MQELQQTKTALLAALQLRARNPFPVFLWNWALTLLPLAGMLGLLVELSQWPILWCFTALIAGFTQNALGILMHEGSHFFFHRSKRMSDIWCNLLVCLPIFNTVRGYRTPHFEHHRSSGEMTDPYFELYSNYPTRRHLCRQLALDFGGITALLKFFERYRPAPNAAEKSEAWYALPALLVIQGGIAIGFWLVTGKWFAYLFLWVIPLMTIPVVINRLRTIVEHYPGFLGIKVNRTSLTGFVEYLCIAPYGYGHHSEHHLLPQIPYYELGFAHRYLEQQGVIFTENEVNSQGYLKTFIRLISEMGARRTAK